eukprot:7391507-Pyramimonas_sp.AAC.1
MAPVDKRIGFFGAGQMCEALAKGFISADVAKAELMTATDISEERRNVLGRMGIKTTTSNTEVLSSTHLPAAAQLVAGEQTLGVTLIDLEVFV